MTGTAEVTTPMVLREAAQVIRELGHGKVFLAKHVTGYPRHIGVLNVPMLARLTEAGAELCETCLMGSMVVATVRLGAPTTLTDAVLAVQGRVGNIPTWNDAAGRTAEEAIHVLELAAGELEAQT